MDIELVDVTLHFKEPLADERREGIEEGVHALDGVISTHLPRDNPRVMVVEINPRSTSDARVLEFVRGEGVEAELSVPEHL